ncbi:carbohydrate ABC transporter permease [Allostreptomyces psammosilenae]|uniref:Multiple sugar transport system permease protein n=1 Tax=Allostreptomyces psammosilenae TaxID=1892865 RepID=A0A852ZLC8_9ACTN|nr:carbohydrate ABC transporter permease [Allostreptomyces psammosilenae]NYI03199.1 multiple sugar transport system permease protein [Allostreptomyces psammosilenae]
MSTQHLHGASLAPSAVDTAPGKEPSAAPGPTGRAGAGGRRTGRRRPGNAPRRWEIYLPLGLYLLFTLVPFYWMLVFALRPNGSTSLLPWPITFEHFETVWYDLGYSTFFWNSVWVGVASLFTTTVIALAGGYALARYPFRGRNIFLLALLCTQFIPGAMMLIPLFEIFRTLGLINSLWSLVVAETVFQLPLSLILISGFVRNIPMELEEAAWVDGCSRFQAFRAIVLPMLTPGLIAVGSFAFIGAWNNFLFALMFVNEQESYTIPVGLSYTLGEYSVDFGALAAGGVVAALPVVAIFAVIQRYLVRGMSAGAVKG